MHGVMGNSAQGIGYGCQMVDLVSVWREHWSAEPNTTDPHAPFGVVTIAAGTDEGGTDMGGMHWSQVRVQYSMQYTAGAGECVSACIGTTVM
jgi:hypothetical protein